MREKNGGFTLVELMVTILCCSLITLAAVSLTLLGLRMEVKAEDTVSQQQTTRIVLSLLEDMAGSGQITSVEKVGAEDWALLSGNTVLLQYGGGTLTTGSGSVLMEGLKGAKAELDSGLLTFTVETGEGKYTSSVYCRTRVDSDNSLADGTGTGQNIDEKAQEGLGYDPNTGTTTGGSSAAGTAAARYAFLTVLSTQYGSRGKINGDSGDYYSKWYCGGTYWENWNENTPWCACFLSWALDKCGAVNGTTPKFAEVNAWISDFNTKGTWYDNGDDNYAPIPGDLIFFDWELDGSANHVGAVLYVDEGQNAVYTIEGNSGSGVVMLHRYSLSDRRILGYGVLDWTVLEAQ